VKYAFITTNFDYCGDARLLSELARDAEEAGWDVFFIWDHIQFGGEPTVDPWVALSAMAMATERIHLGPMITPLPRRNIAKLARETVSLDRLSNGRLMLGVGAGDADKPEYTAFGDFGNPKERAARWDGIIPLHSRAGQGESISPDELRQTLDYVAEHRTNDDPYDAANFGVTRDADDTSAVGAFAEAGATWWVEGVFTWMMDLEYTRNRIRSGPPRI
jgi:alkanesulfonate monooxygenase SsuD/methylene tetrahydromethanopterin reductase-like flavin-dependent oxidoreductase (luciferase family)